MIESSGLLTPVMFCDEDGCDAEVTNIHGNSRQELKSYAERLGWQTSGGHYCPEHRKR